MWRTTPRPCEVLILTTENDPSDTIVPRLLACEADLTKPFLFADEIVQRLY